MGSPNHACRPAHVSSRDPQEEWAWACGRHQYGPQTGLGRAGAESLPCCFPLYDLRELLSLSAPVSEED